MSYMYRFLFFIVFFTPLIFNGQSLLDSLELVTYQEYTDLNAAIEDKEKVVKLNLRKKKLKEFPMEILEMPNLQYLDISRNKIKEFPDSIVKLKKLQFLLANKVGLERLPQNFGDLHNLKYLDLSQNEISTLPYSFGKLIFLEYADFWDNNLDDFPSTMKDLLSLKKLDLRNILISKTKQESLQLQLPRTKIYFSPPCNCGS